MTHSLSARGERLIKTFEMLELEAYPDPGSDLGKAVTKLGRKMRDYRAVQNWQTCNGSPWTIGWGHTGGVMPGDQIGMEKAQALFDHDIVMYVEGVNRLVTARINQNQFDALVSFAYNVGLDIDTDQTPEGLGDSTLLRYINANKHYLADSEFLKWNKAGGVIMRGLTLRRQAERELFMTLEGGQPA